MPVARPLVALVLTACLAGGATRAAAQAIRNGALPDPLPLLPPDNWWNVDISAAPVDPNSTNFLGYIGATVGMHPDFGGMNDEDEPYGIYGIPYLTVGASQPRVPVTFVAFGSQSDRGFPGHPLGFPIPEEAKTQGSWIEGGHPGNVDPGGDRHMLIVDRDNRILYEIYRTYWDAAQNRWEAESAAIWSLDGNERRPNTWTSADAAGLAILPGLVRYDEIFDCSTNPCTVRPEPIRHAFRFTTQPVNGFVYPASHDASTTADVNAPPLGARLRLKAAVDISGYEPYIQKIFQAMKTYGLILADNGSDMYVQGVHDVRWDNGELNPAFDSLEAADFEVIQLGWQPPNAQPTTAYELYTLTPCRLLDTRDPYGAWGGPALAPPWTAAQRPGPPAPASSPVPRVVRAHGRCGIPDTARALAVNVTVVGPAGLGHVTLFPGDGAAGATSTINFQPGAVRANNAVVPLAASGSGTFGRAAFVPGGGVHVLVDVTGWFE